MTVEITEEKRRKILETLDKLSNDLDNAQSRIDKIQQKKSKILGS